MHIKWTGQVEGDDTADYQRFAAAMHDQEPIDIGGRQCLVVDFAPTEAEHGLMFFATVEEVTS